MGTVALTPSLFDEPAEASVMDLARPGLRKRPDPASSPVRPPAAAPTLDDVISAAWRELAAGSASACPICHGELRPVWSAGPRPVGGRCQDCGTRLS